MDGNLCQTSVKMRQPASNKSETQWRPSHRVPLCSSGSSQPQTRDRMHVGCVMLAMGQQRQESSQALVAEHTVQHPKTHKLSAQLMDGSWLSFGVVIYRVFGKYGIYCGFWDL